MDSLRRGERDGKRRCGSTISLFNVVGLSALMLYVGLQFSVEAAAIVPHENNNAVTFDQQSMRRAQPCPDDCELFAVDLPWTDPDPQAGQVCKFSQCETCPNCASGGDGDDDTDSPTGAPTPATGDEDDNDETDSPTGAPTPATGDDDNDETDPPTSSPSPDVDTDTTDAPSQSPTATPQGNPNEDAGVTDAPSQSPTPGNNGGGGKCHPQECNDYNTVQGYPWKSSDPNADPNSPEICSFINCAGCSQCAEVETDAPSSSPSATSGGGAESESKCDETCYDYSDLGMVWKDPEPNTQSLCDMQICEECPECAEVTSTDSPTSFPSASPTPATGTAEINCDPQCNDLAGIPWTDPDPNAQQICAYSVCNECPQCTESGGVGNTTEVVTDTDSPTGAPTPAPQITGGMDTETDDPTASPTLAPQSIGGEVTETDYPTKMPAPLPTPAPVYYKPAPTQPTTPTYGENHPYKPPDDDILNENDDEVASQSEGQRPPETPQEMLHDRNVEILAGVIAGVAIVLWLLTAHQVMENPDGLCAGICRLCVKCVCLIFKIVCLPCRFICGCGSNKRRGHVPASTIDDSNMRYDLELA